MAERTYIVDLPPGIPTPHTAHALASVVPSVIVGSILEEAADHRDSGEYADGWGNQNSLQYPYLGDPLCTAVVNTLPHADWLEHGRAGFHLPSRWGGKWKVNKDGELYAHIPFRIRTPFAIKGVQHLPGLAARHVPAQSSVWASASRSRVGAAMPEDVYGRAVALEHGERLQGFGDDYRRGVSYEYYRGLFGELPEALRGLRGYDWRASQFEGMFRATSPTPAGGRHTEYMTIRTITPHSEGWYIPPTPALHLAERGNDRAAPVVQQILDEAAAADCLAALLDLGRDTE